MDNVPYVWQHDPPFLPIDLCEEVKSKNVSLASKSICSSLLAIYTSNVVASHSKRPKTLLANRVSIFSPTTIFATESVFAFVSQNHFLRPRSTTLDSSNNFSISLSDSPPYSTLPDPRLVDMPYCHRMSNGDQCDRPLLRIWSVCCFSTRSRELISLHCKQQKCPYHLLGSKRFHSRHLVQRFHRLVWNRQKFCF